MSDQPSDHLPISDADVDSARRGFMQSTLLDALRESAGLAGTKKGCDRGQCGACTVLVHGRRINAGLTLAIMHGDAKITSIEGIAQRDQLAPITAAFMEHDAFQCCYCIPGHICSAVACIDEIHAGTASAAPPPTCANKRSASPIWRFANA